MVTCNINQEQLRHDAGKLSQKYSTDLSLEVFPGKMVQFGIFAKQGDCTSPRSQAQLLYKEGLVDTFPNVLVALCMYLSMMVINCSGERSFSKHAFIKNKQRTSMQRDRLSALCLLSI